GAFDFREQHKAPESGEGKDGEKKPIKTAARTYFHVPRKRLPGSVPLRITRRCWRKSASFGPANAVGASAFTSMKKFLF
ncbi:hypothetical protein F6Y04_06740, partial [Bacillus megaterium]|nr:hypothetical protein [Priestia megaterium]